MSLCIVLFLESAACTNRFSRIRRPRALFFSWKACTKRFFVTLHGKFVTGNRARNQMDTAGNRFPLFSHFSIFVVRAARFANSFPGLNCIFFCIFERVFKQYMAGSSLDGTQTFRLAPSLFLSLAYIKGRNNWKEERDLSNSH